MKHTRSAVLLAPVALIALGIGLLSLPREARAADDSTAALQSLVDGFTDSFNNHDAHAVSIRFAEEADFITVQQATSHSQKGSLGHHRLLLTGTMSANGEQRPARKELYDWIVTRQNGKWLINVLHESELAPTPTLVPIQ